MAAFASPFASTRFGHIEPRDACYGDDPEGVIKLMANQVHCPSRQASTKIRFDQ